MRGAVASAIVRFMDAVDRLLVLVAQLLLGCMVLLTFVSVMGRTFINKTVPDDLLINEMLMVAIVFLPLSYVQSVGAHLEVTVLTDVLPKKVQEFLATAGLAAGVVVFGLVAYLGWINAYDSYESGAVGWSSVLYIPEWPAKMLIPLGVGWWCLRMLVQLLIPNARPAHAETELSQALDETDSDREPDSQVADAAAK